MEKINKYFEDKKFIQWVLSSDEELGEWWKLYEKKHQNETQNILEAKRIIQYLKTSDRELSDEEKLLLFSKILKQVANEQFSQKNIKVICGILKYAAVAILFFSIGALLFYRHDNFNPQFYSQQLTEPISENEATLIRPNGENIVLKNKRSVIEYKKDGQIVVNDNVIKSQEQIKSEVPVLNQLVIPYGKTSEVFLSDGTKVYLNAGSRLVYPDYFKDKNREVFLVGEAFFDVQHNDEHPFVVQTTAVRIKVLGTRFNVSAYPADKIVETVLAEGKVRLEENNSGLLSESIDLLPNQLASFNKSTKEMKIREVNTDDYVLWKENLFKFESTDLSRVVKKLERYYNIRFIYGDPLLGTIKISGKLELEENSKETLNRLAVAASVKITQKGENVYEINR
ncbi:MAG TPA: FecR domain-containing protein [Draconibacterium sp.]|nr:FecR domain-containing protein [Draconibacterium sp.]